jgi:lysophospholipase L1-like esterase
MSPPVFRQRTAASHIGVSVMRLIYLALFGMLLLVGVSDGAKAEALPGKVRLVLPPVIYATPEVECNLYFDNAILTTSVENYTFDVKCNIGLQMSERWAVTPTNDNVGHHPIIVDVRDNSNQLVARGESIVRVELPPRKIEKPITLLIVGDSLTEASVYPQQIVELANGGGTRWLELIGTRGPNNMPPSGDVKHEGYSGWTANAFTLFSGPLARSGYYKRGATGSPFIYESPGGVKTLDFARYCADVNSGKCPDLVTIGLGTNDVFGARDDNIEAELGKMFEHYNAVVESIRAACPQTLIGVQLTTPPSTSEDGFRNYRGAGKQTRWQYRRNQHRLVERLLARYGGRESEHIFVIPTYLNLDAAHNFPTARERKSARSTDFVVRVTNGAHPSEAGYKQIGDAVYAWAVAMQQQSCTTKDVTTN